MLDLSFEFVLPALEPLDVPFDLPFERAFAQFENAHLPFEFLLEELQGWKGHPPGPPLQNDDKFMTFHR